MSSTYNGASFLQTSSHDASRKQAAVLLRAAAKKANSPELAMLATAVELDAFTKVTCYNIITIIALYIYIYTHTYTQL